jgi:hypothetical protein
MSTKTKQPISLLEKAKAVPKHQQSVSSNTDIPVAIA